MISDTDLVARARQILRSQPRLFLKTFDVSIGDWRPQPNCCHDNVDIWLTRNPSHKAIRGFLVLDYWLFVGMAAHSAVELEDGTLAEITPLQAGAVRPFIRFRGTDDEFKPFREAVEIRIPAADLDPRG